ncbi:MAG: WapI family immunity protein [Acidimicrobiales bacterium]
MHRPGPAGLRVDELARFRKQLQDLYRTLEGEARLESIEDWLNIVATGDGLGHVNVVGSAMDEPGMGNELRFRLQLDQTYLPAIIDSLLEVEAAFPILGKP